MGVGKQTLVEQVDIASSLPANTAERDAHGDAEATARPGDRAAEGPTGASLDTSPEPTPGTLEALEAELGDGEPLHGHDAELAQRAGADPAVIRVHRGPAATRAAAERGAIAFTVGHHVVMGGDAPAAGTPGGDDVLLHEAAHVAQQGDAARDPVARKQPIGAEQPAAEHDAERFAGAAGVASANALATPGDAMRTGLQVQRFPWPQLTPRGVGSRSLADKAALIRTSFADDEEGWARVVVDVFEQTEPAARVVLQRQLDMAKIVQAMPDFEATRLGTLGPLTAGQSTLNRKRAAYIEQVINDFGDRAEVFVLFALRGVYDDDAYTIFEALANHRYLHKLLAMPEVAKQIKARGLKVDGFGEPGAGLLGAAGGVLGGMGAGLRHFVKDDRPGKYAWQKAQLPPEYADTLSQMEMEEFESGLTVTNAVIGAIDQVSFGVPHGVVDLGRNTIGAVGDIAHGEYRAAGEKLAGAAVVVLTHLGVKAWKVLRATSPRAPASGDGAKPVDTSPGLQGPEGPGQFVIPSFEGPITAQEAKLGAIFDLNPEAQAAMGRLIARVGRGGVEKLADLVQANSRAALFVAEHGEAGAYALLEAEGDAALAETQLAKRQLPPGTDADRGSTTAATHDHAKEPGSHDPVSPSGDALKREHMVTPGGATLEIVAKGKAVVPTGKVEAYLRGGVKPFTSEMNAEMKRLQELKQRSRKEFDKSPEQQKRIDELKKLQHNFERSQDMANTLDEAGLVDTPGHNAALLAHLLEVGQKVTPEARVDIASSIAGPTGHVKLLTTWTILPDGRAYLSTIKVIPRT